ncbi:4'-phosphopantetheinyl transferase family protein [Cytobacillus oceanisediminis]|uniref:4'-phosphopantetheinyl transferase family protein n=1 Tax=Cytobacillus oceanisediminis TaxID=665099 RepID=UPI00207AEDA7|nr:4'-phosphopantetheinyl transferase superfamily protein [Cytobacillus oceanisediminis]USK44101.1 4'-phosphopantetheinyl transferase superfamily protein [Cytobacillus oceanisediminis]
MKVFALRIDESFPENILLPKAHKKRTSMGKLLLNYVLKEYYQLPSNMLSFKKGIYGKPFLQDYNIHFNISHSGNMVICAVDYHEIGIDVERVAPRKLDTLISLFSDNEQKYLKEMSSKDQLNGFYKIWTRKESYIKALGVSLNKDILKSIDTIDDKNSAFDLKGLSFKTFKLYGEYIISICSKQSDFKLENLIVLQEKLLLKM